MLNEQDRAKLDGIVQQMTANKESDANIQMVVNDFKQKYTKAPVATPAPETGIVQDIAQGIAKPFLGMASQARDVATSVGDLGTAAKQVIQGKPVAIPARPNQTEYDYGYLGKVKSFGSATPDKEGVKAFERAVGAGAGVASNIAVGGPLKTIGKNILARTLPKVLQLAKEGILPGALSLGGSSAQEGNSALQVAGDTLAGGAIGSAGNVVVGSAVPAIVKPVTRTIDKLTKPLQTHMSDVAQNINRALSTQGKKSIGVFLKNPQKQYKAFEIMHDMAPNLKVVDEAGDIVPWNPKETDFNQFAQAFKDAKDKTWEGISGAIKEATGKDLHVEAGPILDFLNKTAGNKFTTSEVRLAAQRLSDEVANMAVPGTNGQIPLAGLTEYNKVLNTKISGVLTGTTDNAVRDLEAGLAKQLSEAADSAVEKITDGRFASLKDNYGALKTIEKDLVRRAQQESRQVDNSLGDFMSRYGTIELANGVFQAAQGNVGPLAKGIGAKILGSYSKRLRTPSTYLKKAFSEIDRYKSGEGIQNAAVKGVKAIKDMSKKNPRGMMDYNAEVFPKKKVVAPTNDLKNVTDPAKVEEIIQSKITDTKIPVDINNPNNFKSIDEFINSQGNPVYHGTDAKFDKFSLKDFGKTDEGFLGKGVYLTADKTNAEQYGSNIVESFTNLKNPYTYDAPYMFGGFNPEKIAKDLGLPEGSSAKQITDKLKSMGHDGVVVNEITDNGVIPKAEVVVFDPSQIKTKSQLTEEWNKRNTDSPAATDMFTHNVKNLNVPNEAKVRGVKAIKDMSKKNPRGMMDYNAEVFPKKKVASYVRDTPTGKFADKFTLTEKVPEGVQSRLKVLKSAIETSGKSLKDIYNNNKEAFNYLNDTGAFVTEKGLDETDIPKVIKAIYDVARAHKKAPLPKVSPATKMLQNRL